MKPHYFEQETADADDLVLIMAKKQGYVPYNCLLGGIVAMHEVDKGNSPCAGSKGPREICGGKPGQTDQERITSLELEVKRLKKLLEGRDLSGIYHR